MASQWSVVRSPWLRSNDRVYWTGEGLTMPIHDWTMLPGTPGGIQFDTIEFAHEASARSEQLL